ncbi:HAD-IA family hydrolase [Rhabdothermincola sediminis]|uniref:HAD-IA family hydrolase n=1 Tax=Rhabdothermincola sediminis TaxID=2751370 RepID=UPI001AA0AE71|nr:HAD-IA family hydrolase [Rhabdothermincola sediminis]
MRYHTVLFDLDGTLTDPREGLLNGLERALATIGMTVEDRDSLDILIGPPAHDGFARYLGLTEPSLSVAVAAYREYVAERGAFENRVIDGVPELLAELTGAGASLAVATSKPTPTAMTVLDHFGLTSWFAFVAGADYTGDRQTKRDVIEHALRELRVRSPEGVVMVGDREHDVIAARHLGVASIGVLWGYGPRSELEDAGADHVVETVAELRELLLSRP